MIMNLSAMYHVCVGFSVVRVFEVIGLKREVYVSELGMAFIKATCMYGICHFQFALLSVFDIVS